MYNAVLETIFSDESVITPVGSPNMLIYSGVGGEYSFHSEQLVNATVYLLSRDGLIYTQIDEDDTFSDPAKKEFKHLVSAGDIVFSSGLPSLITDEDVVIQLASGLGASFTVSEPVTLVEAKNWLKMEGTDEDDAIIEMLITSARQQCESYVNRSFVQRTVTAKLRNELGGIQLPYGPVNELSTLTDSAGDLIDSDNYSLSAGRLMYPYHGEPWSAIREPYYYPFDPVVTVVYTAGYVVLPRHFKNAILMQTAWLYQHRGDDENQSVLSPDAKIVLKPYRSII